MDRPEGGRPPPGRPSPPCLACLRLLLQRCPSPPLQPACWRKLPRGRGQRRAAYPAALHPLLLLPPLPSLPLPPAAASASVP